MYVWTVYSCNNPPRSEPEVLNRQPGFTEASSGVKGTLFLELQSSQSPVPFYSFWTHWTLQPAVSLVQGFCA